MIVERFLEVLKSTDRDIGGDEGLQQLIVTLEEKQKDVDPENLS
jgi:hypothetical protein